MWIDRRGVLKKGMILPLQILGYGIGRFVVEGVRIDPATLILGIRVNHWVSGGAVLVSAVVLVWLYRTAAPSFYARKDSDTGDAEEDSELAVGTDD